MQSTNSEYLFVCHFTSLHKFLTDGLEWCDLLWCFYQLFGLSFWRHPFTCFKSWYIISWKCQHSLFIFRPYCHSDYIKKEENCLWIWCNREQKNQCKHLKQFEALGVCVYWMHNVICFSGGEVVLTHARQQRYTQSLSCAHRAAVQRTEAISLSECFLSLIKHLHKVMCF